MRWLTREWAGGGLDDAQYAQAIAGYWEHRSQVLPRLPAAFGLVLGERDVSGHRHTLHDARVVSWVADLPRRLELRLICWGPAAEDEPEALEIVYSEGVELVGPDERTLAAWLGNPETEFVYEEADALADGRFEHRHLLWPEGEFGVRFGDIALAVSLASAEEYQALRERTG
jgi:hypothetical protein